MSIECAHVAVYKAYIVVGNYQFGTGHAVAFSAG